MRSQGISSPPDLSRWFETDAAEFVVGEACRFDARVALLEACYVRVTLHVGQQMAVPPDSVPVGVTRRVETGASVGENQRWSWKRLDVASSADVEDMPTIHARKVSAMGEVQSWIGKMSCPSQELGKSSAVLVVPVMLLHRQVLWFGTESCRFRGPVVGRCIRVHSSETPSDYHHSGGRAETQRPGCSVTQRGQVSHARQE